MKLNAKDIFIPTFILLVICVITTAALAGTNLLTADLIKHQGIQSAENSKKIVLPGTEIFEDSADNSYYIGKSSDQITGYVFNTESKGYGGTIKVMTGINKEGSITGVVILSHNETPGLGANAQKQDFLKQFNQNAPINGLKVVKFQKPNDGEVEAITGATITTKAVDDAVNLAIEKFNTVKEGN